ILYRVFTALITAFHNTATRSISDRKVRTCFGRSVLVRENSFQAIPKVSTLSTEMANFIAIYLPLSFCKGLRFILCQIATLTASRLVNLVFPL
ncbi:MAG: hypothetical protein IJQ82_02815, partial [Selenomonadaceae bacterium]|nr:hypothetical protein [Selenomonadaceae bacterium]